jgi:capsular exopolysaccharide synthesis family protein
MQRPLSYYLGLAKRWIWLVILGIVMCGSGTYIYTRLETPIYQASAVIVVNVFASSANNAQASIAAAPTYAQLVTNPEVLQPVLDMNPGMTLQQLSAMLTVSAQPNTQLVEVDVQNSVPQLAAQLANQVSQSFVQYANTQFPGTVQVLPAQVPNVPVKPKPLVDTAVGALAGLSLAIALIFLFEWLDNRVHSPEEVQQLLDMEVLAVIPYVSRRKRRNKPIVVEEPGLAEIYRTLCANLNVEQAIHPFKLIMVTSSQVGEGKSNISANLASFLARTGKRVLLVDADLHHPKQAQHFQLNNHYGLTTIFLDPSAQARWVLNGQATSIPTLRVLTAGVLPPNPAELLQTALGKQLFSYFREGAPFDYIVMDTPPLLALADTQILASLVHATVVVADVDKTPRRVLVQANHILKRTNARVVGVVINKCRWPEYRKPASSYYYYYSSNGKQPEVATSMFMDPGTSQPTMVLPSGTSFPNASLPADTPPSSYIVGSTKSGGPDSIRRSPLPFGERINQNGRHVSNPVSWKGDSGMIGR